MRISIPVAVSGWLAAVFCVAPPATADRSGIEPPAELEVRDRPDDGGGAIELRWRPSPSAGVVDQRLVRIDSGGVEREIASVGPEESEYVDEGDDELPLSDGDGYRYLVRAVGEGGVSAATPPSAEVSPRPSWIDTGRLANLAAVLLFAAMFFFLVRRGSRGAELYIRPIAGLEAAGDAVGRAAEMGRPVLYAPGLTSVTHPVTVASIGILSKVAERAARLRTRIKVPNYDPLTYPVAQSVVRQAFHKAGRAEDHSPDDVSYLTSRFLTYAAAVAGMMTRERTASNFLIGHFFSEALILAETGAATGAVQIGGTDSVTQLPFIITTCDHTMIGEELFAAAALAAGDPISRSTVKANDWFKMLTLALILVGLGLSLLGAAGVSFAPELLDELSALLEGGR
ncbi:MAG: DUF6754 domain-containing protein [Polyangia bacterium]